MATSAPRVTLYSKPGCHLCEQAEALIGVVARSQPLTVEHVDIESTPALFAEFRYRIPVIAVDGGQTLEWPTTAERIRKAVAAVVSAS